MRFDTEKESARGYCIGKWWAKDQGVLTNGCRCNFKFQTGENVLAPVDLRSETRKPTLHPSVKLVWAAVSFHSPARQLFAPRKKNS